jgi:hypothetical protein
MPTRSGEDGCRDEAAGQSAAKVGYRIVKHPATPGGRYFADDDRIRRRQ